MSATDSNFYKTLDNVQREKTKLFYLIKLGEASLKNGKIGTMSKVGERGRGGGGGVYFWACFWANMVRKFYICAYGRRH